MNRFELETDKATGATSSRGSTDDDDWTTDESSGRLILPSLQNDSALDIATRSANDGLDQTDDGTFKAYNPYPEKKKTKRKKQKQSRRDFQSLPLVPYIDERDQDRQYQITPAQNTHAYQRPRHRGTPLIELIQDEWHARSMSSAHLDSRGDVPDLLQVLSAPKFRRWGLVGLIFFCFCWANWNWWAQPQWHEHTLLKNAVDGKSKSGFSSFGTNMRPQFRDMVHMKNLNHDLTGLKGNRSRFVIIGDVHGCIDECEFSYPRSYSEPQLTILSTL